MSINDPGLQVSRKVAIDGRSVLLERRLGLIPDNLLDVAARRYAVALRLGGDLSALPPMSSYTLSRDVTRVR